MSGMSLLAQSEGLKMDAVAIMNTVRIFALFFLVPVSSRLTLYWRKLA